MRAKDPYRLLWAEWHYGKAPPLSLLFNADRRMRLERAGACLEEIPETKGLTPLVTRRV